MYAIARVALLALVTYLAPSFIEQPKAQGVAVALTVASVKDALIGAIEGLDTLLRNQTGNVKAVGESLTANARGLVSDIDARLKDKLSYTFDRLDAQERRLVEDAQAAIAQINRSGQALASRLTSSAIQVMAEADILVYNTSYSIPCRTQVPRVVYSTPDRIAANDVQEVALRGNFLAFGAEPKVSVDGRPADVLARNANELKIRLPEQTFAGLTSERSAKVAVTLTRRERTNLWVYCWESDKVDAVASASVRVVPEAEVIVDVQIRPKGDIPTSFEQEYGATEGNQDCGANYAVDKQFAVTRGKLVRYTPPSITCTRCGSHISAHRQMSDTTLLITGTLSGCGYDKIAFGVKNCKGRGCLHYKGKLIGEVTVSSDLQPHAQRTAYKGVQQRSFSYLYPHPLPTGAANVRWHYEVTVDKRVGTRVERFVASDSNPNTGPIVTRTGSDGKLALEFVD